MVGGWVESEVTGYRGSVSSISADLLDCLHAVALYQCTVDFDGLLYHVWKVSLSAVGANFISFQREAPRTECSNVSVPGSQKEFPTRGLDGVLDNGTE